MRIHVSCQKLKRSGYVKMSFYRFSGRALNAVISSDDGDARIIHDQTLSAVRCRSTSRNFAYLDDDVLFRLQGLFEVKNYGSAIIMAEP